MDEIIFRLLEEKLCGLNLVGCFLVFLFADWSARKKAPLLLVGVILGCKLFDVFLRSTVDLVVYFILVLLQRNGLR